MIVRYEINYWDEIDRLSKYEKGIIGAGDNETISNVVDKIYNYYGTSNISALKIFELETVLIDSDIEDILKEK